MSNAQEQSELCWQQLANEWSRARDGWNDTTTDHFETHFWLPLEDEMKSYRHALEAMMKTLSAAQAAVAE